jgi:hypothetical protein
MYLVNKFIVKKNAILFKRNRKIGIFVKKLSGLQYSGAANQPGDITDELI